MGDSPKKRYYRGGKQLIEKYAAERSFHSVHEFSRFLHSIEPARTVDGWRNAILRWKKAGGVLTYDKHSTKASKNESVRLTTYYDKSKDFYLCFLPSQESIVKISGKQHRAMRQSYSADGENLAIDDMARKYSKSSSFIREYIAVYNWTHTMDIFTDESIENNSVDDLVETSLSSKRRQVVEKSNKKLWAGIEKDANRMRMLDETLFNEFREAISKQNLASKKVNKRKIKKVRTLRNFMEMGIQQKKYVNF